MTSLIHISNSYFKLFILPSLQLKIDYLCLNFPNVEWSGTLFYRFTKEDSNGIEMEAIDLFLQDIGTTVSTEIESSTSLASYIAYKLDLQKPDIKWGVIHSHHNMAPVFSNVDNNALGEALKSRHFYLSLIVSNYNGYKAKLAVKTKSGCEYSYYRETPVLGINPVVAERVIIKRKDNFNYKNLYVPVTVVDAHDSEFVKNVEEHFEDYQNRFKVDYNKITYSKDKNGNIIL